MGLRHERGLCSIGNRAFHHQRRPVPVRKRLAVVLRPRNPAGGKRGFQTGQRVQAGRRGAVDDHPRRRGLGRGEQFARHLRHRHQHLQGGGAHHEPLLVALHPFHLRRKSLRHTTLGQPYLHRQPQALRNHGLHRMPGHGDGIGLHGADGAIRPIRLRELLVVPEPHSQDRHRNRPGGRRAGRGHSAHVAGDGQELQVVDHHRRRLRRQSLRL